MRKCPFIRIFTILILIVILLLISNKGNISLLEEPLSTIGNVKSNYPFFLIGIGIPLIFLPAIFNKLFKEQNIKSRWEILSIPFIGIAALLIPYNREMIISRIAHTVLGIIAAAIIIWAIHHYNKNAEYKNRKVKLVSETTPPLAVSGTLIIYLTSGLNTIMELFYLAVIITWVNMIGCR